MTYSRRRFLRTAVAASAGALSSGALEALFARAAGAKGLGTKGRSPADSRSWQAAGYGPLLADPAGLLDLPAGFRYRALSMAKYGTTSDPRFSEKLSNGDFVPCLHDGMGAFAGPAGMTVLVRNHEVGLKFGPGVDPERKRPYDPLSNGGTTTLWVNAERGLVRSFASLSGTVRNCAGGVTPWGSWLTCEECTHMPGKADPVNHDRTPLVSKRHGYVFEVDAAARDLVEPRPILGMGRFYHEACAVDPVTGYVYLTEDRDDGVLYRYRPDVLANGKRRPAEMRVGDLAKGGVLEALRIEGQPRAKTQNWENPLGFTPGKRWRVAWVKVPNADPDMDMERDPLDQESDLLKRRGRTARASTRAQAFAAGAAQFARVEGIVYGRRALYWCATNGGMAGAGQVWKFDLIGAEISLVVEPDDLSKLDGPDNIVVAPNGDLIVCEDGAAQNFVVGITPAGKLYRLARNAYGEIELAGACFSPDGRTMFVNIQEPGITFAVWGPWGKREG
ncbi:MAG: alkaline phosphatase PhoX [Candidatus Eisenbacteria bacterium]